MPTKSPFGHRVCGIWRRDSAKADPRVLRFPIHRPGNLRRDQETYAATLTELQEAFYYFKGETQERFTDDELIEFMAAVFNGRAQGSSEYLICTSLEALCRYARGGFDEHDADGIGDLF